MSGGYRKISISNTHAPVALGGVLGLALGAIGIRVLLSLAPTDLPRVGADSGQQVAVFDWTVLGFTLDVALLTGLLFGIFPAVQIARTDVNSVLKETSSRSGTGRHHWMRSVLVVAETALALVLLIGAGLMMRTFAGLKGVDPGFDPTNVLTMATSLAGACLDRLCASKLVFLVSTPELTSLYLAKS